MRMPRLTAPLYRASRALSSSYHTTAAHIWPAPYFPKDWKILEASPGGIDLTFVHRKTGAGTFYTPEGMSAEQILAIAGARRYWNGTEEVERYIGENAVEKKRSGGDEYHKPWK